MSGDIDFVGMIEQFAGASGEGFDFSSLGEFFEGGFDMDSLFGPDGPLAQILSVLGIDMESIQQLGQTFSNMMQGPGAPSP